ncbi:hypothetical protein DPEC_G00050450 [Dallia pectoralis]|uniref:Uncharacterized protein n=1 Tax=Dallia pectoralis TaxID=75939 RepID=A0ACC2HBT7_DALPE|nr:hypothetical protein DPEC_G00050450 [Dallia pectoralis]
MVFMSVRLQTCTDEQPAPSMYIQPLRSLLSVGFYLSSYVWLLLLPLSSGPCTKRVNCLVNRPAHQIRQVKTRLGMMPRQSACNQIRKKGKLRPEGRPLGTGQLTRSDQARHDIGS